MVRYIYFFFLTRLRLRLEYKYFFPDIALWGIYVCLFFLSCMFGCAAVVGLYVGVYVGLYVRLYVGLYVELCVGLSRIPVMCMFMCL